MGRAPGQMLTSLLRDVSRSFYLTVRVLPREIRPQVGLAYLLARTTDTIADTDLVPIDQRLHALGRLRGRILGRDNELIPFGELARHQASAAERTLLEHCESSLTLLENLDPKDRQLIRNLLEIITSGQELDLRRFAGASVDHLIALQNEDELDDYTYRVAGCVGEFWTKMCRDHLFSKAPMDEAALLANGARFGKGLQLVNILRDLPADLRQGRCYLPATELTACGLAAEALLLPANENQLRPLYNRWLDRAEAHLRAGWAYTHMLPRTCVRVRLACAWPLLIGRETVNLLRKENVLDPEHRLKISRRRVRSIIARSIFFYPSARAWQNLYPE